MAEHPKRMLYRVFGTRLLNNTGAGESIYVSYVPEDASRPYLLITVPSNQERNFHWRKQDPEVIVQIKAVSTNEGTALMICQEAVELIDEQGEQDLQGLAGGSDWHILKVHVEERMSMTYTVGTSRVFEEIIHVRVTLEEKS